jgi:hypothetical protein
MKPTATTMTTTNNLAAQLKQLGLRALPANLDDVLARATNARWSPDFLLEQLAHAEAENASAADWSGACGVPDQAFPTHRRLRLELAVEDRT